MIRTVILTMMLSVGLTAVSAAQTTRPDLSEISLFASSDTTEMLLFLNSFANDSLRFRKNLPIIRKESRNSVYSDMFTAPYSREIPEMAQLKKNYPNPFRRSTIISYEIPERSQIKIQIYDQLGRSVDILIDEPRIAGRHEFLYDASHLPDGIYMYRLEMDSFESDKTGSFTRRFTLLE